MSVYAGQTPKQLYRSFFRYLRHLPDPHVWSILQPRFRALLQRSGHGVSDGGDQPESSARAIARASRAEKNLKDELRKMHMAVSFYPHALRRLLDACYGRTGHVRWRLIQTVLATSDPPTAMQGRPPLPNVLAPLAPAEAGQGTAPTPRARTTVPESAIRRVAERKWARQWHGVQVPLVIAEPGVPKTGWEGKGVLESLRILAALDRTTSVSEVSDPLPTFQHMSPCLQRIYPRKLRPTPIEQYPPPPPRATKENPRKWSTPHRLTARAFRRTYARLWAGLPWVTLSDAGDATWKACSYEAMIDPSHSAPLTSKKRRKVQEDRGSIIAYPAGAALDSKWLRDGPSHT